MMLKILAGFLLVITFFTFSQTMNVHLSGGTVEKINLADIQKLTFDLSGVSVSKRTSLKRIKMALSNIYPNPFNPSTRIRYTVPSKSSVNIGVYNIGGRLVKTLKNEIMRPGQYSITWNGTDENGKFAGAGYYIAKFRVNGFG